jgi:hypothetical protein
VREAGAYEHGKITKALILIARFEEALEADLQRYYQTDIRELWKAGGLSWRRFLVLVEHLPPESSFCTAARNMLPEEATANADPLKARWSSVEMLLALLVDEVRNNTWTYAQSMQKNRIQRPKPVARPGTMKKRRQLTEHQRAMIDPRLREEDEDG